MVRERSRVQSSLAAPELQQNVTRLVRSCGVVGPCFCTVRAGITSRLTSDLRQTRDPLQLQGSDGVALRRARQEFLCRTVRTARCPGRLRRPFRLLPQPFGEAAPVRAWRKRRSATVRAGGLPARDVRARRDQAGAEVRAHPPARRHHMPRPQPVRAGTGGQIQPANGMKARSHSLRGPHEPADLAWRMP